MIPTRMSPWYVDPRSVADEEERERVIVRAASLYACRSERAKKAERLHRCVIRIMLFIAIVLLLFMFLTGALLYQYVMLGTPVLAILMLVAVEVITGWTRRRKCLRQALLEFGDERCVACGHPLRGLPKTVIFCPECGAVRAFEVSDEQLDAAEPKPCES